MSLRDLTTKLALNRAVWLTRASMIVERATLSFWRFWSWAFVIWTALAFHLADRLSLEMAYILALIGVIGLLGFFAQGLRVFHWPSAADALERLDRSLAGRPLSALLDHQAIGANDQASIGVWRAHLAQMSARAAKARAVLPDLRLSSRDPFGLRYVAATALVVALLFGSISKTGPLVGPSTGPLASNGPIFEGWVEPPRYTGLPVIYLNQIASGDPLPVPVGSKVTLRIYGAGDGPGFRENVSASTTLAQTDDQPDGAKSFMVAKSGEITILGRNAPRWQIKVIPDLAPKIALTAPLDRSPRGELKLSFKASDDYGVVAGSATIALDLNAVDRRYGLALPPEERRAITLDIPLPYNGDTKEFSDVLVEDLSKNPWVGLPVTLTLRAQDARGQKSVTMVQSTLLPGRKFFDPLAASIVEQRRDLLWNRKNARRVAQVLRAVSYLPEDGFDNPTAYLILRTAIRRLEFNLKPTLTDTVRTDVAELLWKTAVLIEDGNLTDAQARLKRAQDRLSEALKNGANDQEIAQLTEELRRAMQQYLRRLAQQSAQNPDQQQANNQNSRTITGDQLQKMLDRIEQLSREGRHREAQQLLEQLRQMMKDIQTARRQSGQGQSQQAMRGLQDTMRQQQRLSDEAFRKLQQQFNGQQRQGNQSQGGSRGPGKGADGSGSGNGNGGQQGQGQNGTSGTNPGGNQPSAGDLAQRQQALRQLLQSQRQALPNSGSQAGRAARDALKRAERSMDAARDNLQSGDTRQALDNQAQALEALREGIDNLGRQLARNQNPNQGSSGDQAGGQNPNAKQDPLGRRAGTLGGIGLDNNVLPGQNRFMRSRELMQEIRRRTGDKSRPRLELDYLKRLLDRF
ncbi:MAG: TIGR02302 family protein [Alphaproteobacteria bacterium]|nr:TIGR02302 family protein [Alphaproteobacteria bacterium]